MMAGDDGRFVAELMKQDDGGPRTWTKSWRMRALPVALGLTVAACSAGQGGGASPSGTGPSSQAPVPQPGQAFRIAGIPAATPATVLPLPSGRSTYAAWSTDGLLVGAAGSSGCYPVPYSIRASAPQSVRVDFIDPAQTTSGTEARRLPDDVVCTRDYTVRSYKFDDLDVTRSSPVTVEMIIHRGAARGADLAEVSTI